MLVRGRGERPGAVERDGVVAPRLGPDQLARREVAGIERLQRMADEHLVRGASPSRQRAVASIASNSSPTGTAGGSGALVRSSLPL